MATISGSSEEKIFRITKWQGLHQNPDGDTRLKLGEAAVMRNFRITRDGNLQRRPGNLTKLTLETGQPVRGLWSGIINEEEHFLAACGGKLWKLNKDGDFEAQELGSISCDNEVHFFGFSGIVYMLNGKEYKQFDGTTLKDVEGYRPLVNIGAPPGATGENHEQVNKLTNTRRMWISGDGEGTTFQLPETNITSIDWVKDLKTGLDISTDEYTYDLEAGTVTFTTAPIASANNYEIAWSVANSYRFEVLAMRYSELYNGAQDTRVFLYGDGSNEVFYSGVDYDGDPRADYFPDMNEVAIGDSNTPVTQLIRHYSALMCFKTDSAWSIQYGTITLEDSSVIAAFYVTPVNKRIGNEPLGQVMLVLNAPYTLHGSDVYEWRNTSSYNANLSKDERQARRISDRVYSTLNSFDFSKCRCYDDNDEQEFYILYDKRALVFNYAADAWSSYEDFDVEYMCRHNGELYFGTSVGTIEHFSYSYITNNGKAIDAYWESGSMTFDRDYMRKYSAMLWVGVKPEPSGAVNVTVMTDKKAVYSEKLVSSNIASFKNMIFSNFSFSTNRMPKITRLKIKAKKFVFYKLIFSYSDNDATATILVADIKVRYTGMAK